MLKATVLTEISSEKLALQLTQLKLVFSTCYDYRAYPVKVKPSQNRLNI